MFLGALGLVIDVFDFAFRFVSRQLFWRAFLHALFIPIGTTLAILRYNSETISSQAYSVLVICTTAIVIACIGLTIGSYELAVIKVDGLFFQRMGLYSLCIIIGFLLIPLHSDDKIKVT